jgi:urease accessory protein
MARLGLITVTILIGVVLLLAALGADGRRAMLTGLIDPLLGLDHFLGLLGVGLWAGRMGGAERWLLPLCFLAGAPAGYLVGNGAPPFPLAETLVDLLVVGSLLLLTATIIVPLRLPPGEARSSVALMGCCHGYIHAAHLGSEGAVWFSLGSLASAGALLAAGVAVGLSVPRTE